MLFCLSLLQLSFSLYKGLPTQFSIPVYKSIVPYWSWHIYRYHTLDDFKTYLCSDPSFCVQGTYFWLFVGTSFWISLRYHKCNYFQTKLESFFLNFLLEPPYPNFPRQKCWSHIIFSLFMCNGSSNAYRCYHLHFASPQFLSSSLIPFLQCRFRLSLFL